MAAVALLPFEAPLFTVGRLLITTSELALYVVVAAWIAVRLAAVLERGRSARTGRATAAATAAPGWLPLAVAAWLLVLLVAAVTAPAHRSDALKFSLRSLVGGLVFFAARDLVRSEPAARQVTAAVLVGAVLSAGAALAEMVVSLPAAVWLPFRPIGFTATGLPRASGPFGYPTIGAMYWEAALPLLTVVPWRSSGAPAPTSRAAAGEAALAACAAIILVLAIFASATRTALAGATLASAVMWWAGRRASQTRVRVVAAGALATITVVLTVTVLPGDPDSLMGHRLRWWRDGTWFGVRYRVPESTMTIPVGEALEVPVTVENTGSVDWPHAGSQPVRLSYHWEARDASGPRLLFGGRRTALPFDVPRGGVVTLSAVAEAPSTPGRYRLRWDLVREGVTWFSEQGNPTADQDIHVVPGPTDQAGRPRLRHDFELRATLEEVVSLARPTRSELWQSAVRLWSEHPILGVGPDNFRRMYPAVMPPPRIGRRYADTRLHANNLYLETLAGAGLAGLAALSLMAIGVGRRLRAQARDRSPAGLLGLACAVGVASFFVHGALDYFFAFTPTYGLFWVLLALAARGPSSTAPERR